MAQSPSSFTTVPIIEVRFRDERLTEPAIAARFVSFLEGLRRGKTLARITERFGAEAAERALTKALGGNAFCSHIDDPSSRMAPADPDMPQLVDLVGRTDRERIDRRAKTLVRRIDAASGLKHLRKEHVQQLEPLRDGARLIRIESEHRADEIAAELHAEFPWMGPATEVVWQAMRRSVQSALPGLRLPPILLDGPPGIGKSAWARRLGALLSVPVTVVEATNENASFGLVGGQRGWSSATPGRLVQTLLQSQVANPIVVVDEIEKAGPAASDTGRSFDLCAALLPLLEPATARRWSCPFHEVRFDMSWIGWVLTSNDFRRLPEPLLSRCPPIRLAEMTLDDLAGFARREGVRRGLSALSVEVIADVLRHGYANGQRISLRTVIRMLDHAAILETAPVLN